MNQDSTLPSIYDEVKEKADRYSKWAVIIGPEGGFSTEEKNIAFKSKKYFTCYFRK